MRVDQVGYYKREREGGRGRDKYIKISNNIKLKILKKLDKLRNCKMINAGCNDGTLLDLCF